MRRILPLALAASLALPLVAADSTAAEPLFTDTAGDANFVNGQGFVGGIEQSGPMQMPGADVQAVDFETVTSSSGAVEALVLNVVLDGPFDTSSADVVVRVTGDIGSCPMMFAATRELANGIRGYWRFTDAAACGYDEAAASATGVYDMRDGVVIESTDTGFTITVERASTEAFAAAFLKPGTTISGLGAHVRTILVAATAPVVDEVTAPDDVTYKLGS